MRPNTDEIRIGRPQTREIRVWQYFSVPERGGDDLGESPSHDVGHTYETRRSHGGALKYPASCRGHHCRPNVRLAPIASEDIPDATRISLVALAQSDQWKAVG